MKYEKGDKVLVKSEGEIKSAGYVKSVIEERKHFTNKIVTIKGPTNSFTCQNYQIEEDNGKFKWGEDMFKENGLEYISNRLKTYCSKYCIQECTSECPLSVFKL